MADYFDEIEKLKKELSKISPYNINIVDGNESDLTSIDDIEDFRSYTEDEIEVVLVPRYISTYLNGKNEKKVLDELDKKLNQLYRK